MKLLALKLAVKRTGGECHFKLDGGEKFLGPASERVISDELLAA